MPVQKKFHNRFQDLGANVFYPVAFADDAVGLDVVADPWIEGLFPALLKLLQGCGSSNTKVENGLSNNINIETIDNELSNVSQISKSVNPDIIESTTKQLDDIHIDNKLNKNITHINGTIADTDKDKGVAVEEKETESLKVSHSPLSECELSLPNLPLEFLHIDYLKDEIIDVSGLSYQNGYNLPSSNSKLMYADVKRAQVLTADDAVKKTLLIKLDISNLDFIYHPGDAFGIICPNNHNEIMNLIQRLNLLKQVNSTCILSIDENTKKPNARIPQHLLVKSSVYHLLSTCIDIRSTPKKNFLRVLAEYTSDVKQKRRLLELSSKQGADHFNKYIREPSITILDILRAFSSCHPPITLLFEHLTRLQPRPYSCASSQLFQPNEVDIVFNVIDIPYGSGRSYTKKGVCTGWLDDVTDLLQMNDNIDSITKEDILKVPIYLRSNQHFRPPESWKDPVIMIGPGTGVAPFIGFLQHRQYQRDSHCEDEFGECILFYGCRNQNKDYLFREDLQNFIVNETLTELFVSFSRDDSNNGIKYVQDNIKENGKKIANLICEKNACVYVCGDANNMAKDVMQAFCYILEMHEGMDRSNAENYLRQMKLVRRYKEDVWS